MEFFSAILSFQNELFIEKISQFVDIHLEPSVLRKIYNHDREGKKYDINIPTPFPHFQSQQLVVGESTARDITIELRRLESDLP